MSRAHLNACEVEVLMADDCRFHFSIMVIDAEGVRLTPIAREKPKIH